MDKTGGAYSKFIMESQEFDKMYNVVPEDATVEFELDYKKQNAYVQEMMKEITLNGLALIRLPLLRV